MGVLGNAIKFGVIPGAASEAAGEATAGTGIEPWARFIAGAGAGVGADLAATGFGAAARAGKNFVRPFSTRRPTGHRRDQTARGVHRPGRRARGTGQGGGVAGSRRRARRNRSRLAADDGTTHRRSRRALARTRTGDEATRPREIESVRNRIATTKRRTDGGVGRNPADGRAGSGREHGSATDGRDRGQP